MAVAESREGFFDLSSGNGMKVHDVEQGSDDWLKLRAGRITGSELHKVVTASGKWTGTTETYFNQVLGERVLGRPRDSVNSRQMEHGKDAEPMARMAYEFTTRNQVTEVGFVTNDICPGLGVSPDGLVGDDGGVEFKSPFTTEVHLSHVRSKKTKWEYEVQVHGCMLICDRAWWDFCSYHEDFPSPLVYWRYERDKKMDERILKAVAKFTEKLDVEFDRIMGQG